MPIARPEYGPSLPEIAGPRLHRVPPRVRWSVVGVLVLLVAAVAAYMLLRGRPLEQVVIRGPLTFNTRFDDRVKRVPAGPGELLRLENVPAPGRAPEQLVFRDAGPAPTRPEPAGAPVAQLALRMAPIVAGLRREFGPDKFQLRGQGRVKIGRDYAGWLVRYQFYRGTQLWYGVRLLLLPDVPKPDTRVLDMSLQSQQSDVVPNIAMAGSNGPMRTPFYGVAFGTEAP